MYQDRLGTNIGQALKKRDTFSLTGWNLGDHGGWCKQSNFESVARVPLLIHVPGMMAGDRQQLSGRRTDALVEMVDLMPTLLELAAITIR